MNQTFEQKRIVELSKKLDQQRQRCQALVKQTHDQAKQIQFITESFQKQQQHKQQMEIIERQLRSEISHLSQDLSTIREDKTVLEKKLVEAEYSTMRMKQLMEQQKEEHKNEIQKMKEQIFGLEQVIAQKDRENMKLREENLELEKMYLNKRSEMQVSQQKHFKQLSKLTLDFKTIKSQLIQMGKLWQTTLQKEKQKLKQLSEEFMEKVREVEAKIEDAAVLRKSVNELEQKLQEVVVQNSQRIIQLYNVKYNLSR